jgi:hypothetical protein
MSFVRLFRSLVPALLLSVLLAAPGPRAAELSPYVGRWTGSDPQQRPGTLVTWLQIRRSDGTFDIEFRHYDACRLVERHFESGLWSVKGKWMQTISGFVNGEAMDPPYVQEYEVQSVDGVLMRYRHTRTGINFVSRRTEGPIVAPTCENIS